MSEQSTRSVYEELGGEIAALIHERDELRTANVEFSKRYQEQAKELAEAQAVADTLRLHNDAIRKANGELLARPTLAAAMEQVRKAALNDPDYHWMENGDCWFRVPVDCDESRGKKYTDAEAAAILSPETPSPAGPAEQPADRVSQAADHFVNVAEKVFRPAAVQAEQPARAGASSPRISDYERAKIDAWLRNTGIAGWVLDRLTGEVHTEAGTTWPNLRDFAESHGYDPASPSPQAEQSRGGVTISEAIERLKASTDNTGFSILIEGPIHSLKFSEGRGYRVRTAQQIEDAIEAGGKIPQAEQPPAPPSEPEAIAALRHAMTTTYYKEAIVTNAMRDAAILALADAQRGWKP